MPVPTELIQGWGMRFPLVCAVVRSTQWRTV